MSGSAVTVTPAVSATAGAMGVTVFVSRPLAMNSTPPTACIKTPIRSKASFEPSGDKMADAIDFDLMAHLGEEITRDNLPMGDSGPDLSEFMDEQTIMDLLSQEFFNSKPNPHDTIIVSAEFRPTQTLPKCPICSNSAGKHTYYGARTCLSCRGFFRRSVQNQHHPIFKCTGSGNCTIDSKSWKSCKFCRYQKCLQAGMKPAYVQSQEQRKERILQRYGSKKSQPNQINGSMKLQMHAVMAGTFTVEEHQCLFGWYQKWHDFGASKSLDYFCDHVGVFQAILESSYEGKPMSNSAFRSMTKADEYVIVSYYFNEEEIQNLHFDDRMTLIARNFAVLYGLLWGSFSTLDDPDAQMQTYFDFCLRNAANNPRYHSLLDLWQNFVDNGKRVSPYHCGLIQRDSFPDSLKYRQYINDTEKIGSVMASDNALDAILMIILNYICFYSTDFPDQLREGEKIKTKQNNYLALLHRYTTTMINFDTSPLEALITDQFIHDILSEDVIDPCSGEDVQAWSTLSESTLSPKTEDESVSLRLCQVCGLHAGKHNYYGGQVCESCRAFFRRSVQNQSYPTYMCKASGACDIDSKSRRSCACCRYEKCLEAGMNPKWIISDEERRVKREHKRAKVLKAKDVKRDKVLPISRGLDFEFTTEEELKVMQIRNYAKTCKLNHMALTMAKDGGPLTVLWDVIFNKQNVPLKFLETVENREKALFQGISMGLEEMTEIDVEDRQTLVQENGSAFFALIMSLYSIPNNFKKLMNDLTRTLEQMSRTNPNVRLTNVLDTLEVLKLSPGNHPTYETFYGNVSQSNKTLSEAHRALVTKIQHAVGSFENNPPDEMIVCLVILNLVFRSHGAKLHNKAKVERVQNNFAFMLYRYLKSRFAQKAGSKMAKALMLTTYTTE
eukprot:maker-scaffold42_size484952-snap-gene-3.25 protein:Tk06368 transcript:maker-scaffold42_size484952-snap-gene-3.25-mRNA-1 annotation:"retinoid x"